MTYIVRRARGRSSRWAVATLGLWACAPTPESRAPYSPSTSVEELNAACGRGDVDACVTAGGRYVFGRGVAPDYARAYALFRDGCEQGRVRGCVGLGVMMRDGAGMPKDLERAEEVFSWACEQHDELIGCVGLASVYLERDDADRERARALLRRACDAGEGGGCSGLAVLALKHGPRDDAAVVGLWERACELEDPVGCYNLGVAHRVGQYGRAVSPEEAARWLTRACDGGVNEACYGLAFLYGEGEGVAQDDRRAQELYKRACDRGLARGCRDLAATLLEGEGDREAAIASLDRACTLGQAGSCELMALQLGRLPDEQRDDARVIALLERACAGGLARSCGELGARLAQGAGVSKDRARASEFNRTACDGGDADSCVELAFDELGGVSERPDLPRARELLSRSCYAGNASACAGLAWAQEHGSGGPKDLERAVALHERACDAAKGHSCHALVIAEEWALKEGGVDPGSAVALRAKERIRALRERACMLEVQAACDELAREREANGEESSWMQIFKP